MPPENLEIDGVPAEYPDDSADPAQPSHRQVPGFWHCCMGLVYHCCRPASAHTDSMPVRLHHIVADAHDLPGLARFRMQAPGWKVLCAREGEIVIGTRENAAVGPCLMPVTDPKTVNNRLHPDLTSSAQGPGPSWPTAREASSA